MKSFMQKFTHQEILSRQKEKQFLARLPFCVVLNNIRSLYNVGSVFRTADGAGIEKLWLCGITGCPPNTMIAKTALGAQEHLPWEHATDALSVIRSLKEKGYQIVLLEQARESILYQNFVPPNPVCLVLGNEISGVSDELLSLCDSVVEIEMRGVKNSLNVSVAFGIVAYYIASKLVA